MMTYSMSLHKIKQLSTVVKEKQDKWAVSSFGLLAVCAFITQPGLLAPAPTGCQSVMARHFIEKPLTKCVLYI